jgi:hypothetical protein
MDSSWTSWCGRARISVWRSIPSWPGRSRIAQSFCGPRFRAQRDRGKPTRTPWAPWWMATYHPSAILRAATEEDRARIEREMMDDLRATARAMLDGCARP